jgi:Ca2+-binding RTX toxin-like protein
MHVERLEFADQSIVLGGLNAAPVGALRILDAATDTVDTTPTENQLLRVSIAGVTDANNVSATNPTGAIPAPVAYFWQVETVPGSNVFDDIIADFAAGEIARTFGPTFTPTDAEVGLRLRVRAVYKDANGVLEEVFSAPTAAVGNVNDAPTGTPTISDTTPTEGIEISASTAGIADADGLTTAVFQFQWQRAATAAGPFTSIIGATAATYTPVQADVLGVLRVVVTFTDDGGTTETLFSAATSQVGDHITGNGNNNNLSGTPFDDWIEGLGGADVLSGLAGDDLLSGGAGNDTMFGGAGNDWLLGDAGNDTLSGDAGIDTLQGGAGNDTYLVDEIIDQISEDAGAAGGNDTVQTTLNAYTLPANVEILTFTGAGNFTGTGNAIANTINGAGGNDLLSGLGGDDTLNGNAGADTLDGGAGNDGLTGGAGDDNLIGGVGVDNLNGGAGDDVLNGGLDNDVLAGGGGTDTASYAGETSNMVVDLVAGTARRGTTLEDTLTSIESAIGGGGNDSLSGTGGANSLDGGAGDDTLIGGGGADALLGGTGNDRFNYTMGDGADAVDGGAGTDLLAISSNGGTDILDVLWNGTRLTNFEGGSIADIESVTANLGAGTDTLNYLGSTAGISVNLATGTASGFSAISNIENVTGTNSNDSIFGGAGANTLSGQNGDDTFTATVIVGGDGNDNITGGGGIDTYDLSLTSANATVTTTTASSTQIGTDTLNGIENIKGSQGNDTITLNGNANVIDGQGGNDVIDAGGSNDTVSGGTGNDTITGGTGADLLTGGADIDTFDFNALNESSGANIDTITDFQGAGIAGGDVIDLADLDANGGVAGNQAFTFIGTAAFTAAGQLRYTQVGGDTIIQGNTNGNIGNIEFELRLTGLHSPTAGDFIL